MPLLDLNNNLTTVPPEAMPAMLQSIFDNIADNVNSSPQIYFSSLTAALPQGIKAGDLVLGLNSNNNPVFGIYNGVSTLSISQDSVVASTGFLGNLSDVADPTTTNFPNDNQWGFFKNTVSGNYFLAQNVSGTIMKTQLT